MSPLKIKRTKVTEKGVSYETFRVSGRINGQRIRKQFPTREEAEGEKLRLEVLAANSELRTVTTRLTEAQVRAAETAFQLTPDPVAAIQWFIAHYRADAVEKPFPAAAAEFIAFRKPHISRGALRDYERTLRDFGGVEGIETKPGKPGPMYPNRLSNSFTAPEVEAFLKAYASGPKRHNNMRGDLCAFFNYCISPARKWAKENPTVGTTRFDIARGIPDILTPQKAADIMAYVEAYAGAPGANDKPGFLVPYFALCLFAGIRPSIDDGEIRKLGESPDVEKLIDLKMGVIRITPGISKIGDVRQTKIRPNLAEWLARYPVKEFPVIVRNMQDKVTAVRKHFGLTDDVLRHTAISAHVAKWKSMGEAALEFGNSERMIKKHYLNMLSEAEAEAFWGITPKLGAANVVAFERSA